jgi:hypothetical protein
MARSTALRQLARIIRLARFRDRAAGEVLQAL